MGTAADGTLEITPVSRDLRVRLAAYVGMLCAYLAAVKNDPLTPFQLAFFGLAAAWSLGFEHRFRRPFFSPPIKIGLIALGAAIFVVFVAGNVGGTTEHFANSIARFLFWNAIVFVLSRNKSEYDLWTLAIIELSLFMISGSFVQPSWFVPLLLGSVACLLYTFQRTALLRCGAAGEQQKGGWLVAGITLVLVLEAAAVLFIAFPRGAFRSDKPPDPFGLDAKAKPPMGEPVPTGAERVGIPKHPQYLDLTSYEKLKADPRPVLRLRVRDRNDKPVPPEMTQYLRGAVHDTYENGRWKAAFRRQDRSDAQDGKQDGWTELERNPAPGRTVVRQQIVTKGLAGDLSFALPDPVRVQLPRAKYDPAGILFFASPPTDTLEYFVESALMPQDIPTSRKPGQVPAAHLQLPPGLERIRETAKKQTEGVGADQLHARTSRLLQYLRRNGFTYKLDPFVPAEGKDPVEHFLEKRAGYCTHYASALALMCRAAGVPARVATGFQLHDPGEDGSFLVRNSDAHAWVEVWFGPEHGWRAYDATPDHEAGAALPPEGQATPTGDTKKPGEKEKTEASRWDDFILAYDPKLQSESLGRAISAVAGGLAAAGRALVSPPVAGTLAALLLAAVVAYLLLPRSQRRRIRQVFAGFRDQASVDFYRDFLWALSRRGIRKHPALTPREFAGQVRLTVKEEGIDFVTDKFYEAKYRGTPPTADDRRRIDEVIHRLLV